MILEAISLLDCAVFVLLLVPQLLYQLGPITTVRTVVQVLPFLGMKFPMEADSAHETTIRAVLMWRQC